MGHEEAGLLRASCIMKISCTKSYSHAFISQHRYYGKSIPFGGDKAVAYSNTSTLGYLTSTQALADYATLITDLKKNLSALDSPVVVLGGSYGGSMCVLISYFE